MCPTTGSTPVMCPYNTESDPGSTQCTLCPKTFYSIQGGSCVKVQYGWQSINQPFLIPRRALYGSYTDGENEYECEPGYLCYSESGTPTPPTLCPAGFYCNSRGSPSFIDASPCPSGTYKPGESMAKSIADCLSCEPGYYCPTGSVEGIVCPRGFYCPEGTASYAEYSCPDGTFTVSTGASMLGQCETNHCPNGR